MPRKFRLGVHRKNEFSKKRTLHLMDPDHPAASLDILMNKMENLAVLPKGRSSQSKFLITFSCLMYRMEDCR